jgi:hypothetical protein
LIITNNLLIFTKWSTPVAIFGAFLIAIFGAYSITDYINKVSFFLSNVLKISLELSQLVLLIQERISFFSSSLRSAELLPITVGYCRRRGI